MDKMDAWSIFLTTGNVLDYLRYTAIQNADEYFDSKGTDETNSEGNENPVNHFQ